MSSPQCPIVVGSRPCESRASRLIVEKGPENKGFVYQHVCLFHGDQDPDRLILDVNRALRAQGEAFLAKEVESVSDRCSVCSSQLPLDGYLGPVCKSCREEERAKELAETLKRLAEVQEKAKELSAPSVAMVREEVERAMERSAAKLFAMQAANPNAAPVAVNLGPATKKALAPSTISPESQVDGWKLHEMMQETLLKVQAAAPGLGSLRTDTAEPGVPGDGAAVAANSNPPGLRAGYMKDIVAMYPARRSPGVAKVNGASKQGGIPRHVRQMICAHDDHSVEDTATRMHDGALYLRRRDTDDEYAVASLCRPHIMQLGPSLHTWIPDGWTHRFGKNPTHCVRCGHTSLSDHGLCWFCKGAPPIPTQILDGLDQVLDLAPVATLGLDDNTRSLVHTAPKTAIDMQKTAQRNAQENAMPITMKEPAVEKLAETPPLKRAARVLRADANDAAWRLAGSQFVKLARDPLVGALSRHLGPGDESLRARIAAFLETELGSAILASLLSAGLSALPSGLGSSDVPERLARELRVRSMAGAGDVVADVLMGPLREVMSLYLRGVPETDQAPHSEVPGLPDATTGLPAGGVSAVDADVMSTTTGWESVPAKANP